MYLAKTNTGAIISSEQARSGEIYLCLNCGEQLQLRISKKQRPFFAHHHHHHQGGEGQSHQAVKARLRAFYPNLQVEQKFGKFRADIVIGSQVIEIQASQILVEKIQQRRQNYGNNLHWLLTDTVQTSREADFLDIHGKLYRYSEHYCECIDNIHPLFRQKALVLSRPVAWEAFVSELERPMRVGLPYRQFCRGLVCFERWRATYSTRHAKIQDDYAQSLYRWGLRSEDLPNYVGLPIPIVARSEQLPIIWQGTLCWRLALGHSFSVSELEWSQQFYLFVLVSLGVCDKKDDTISGYRRNHYNNKQLYLAYRSISQSLPSPV